MKEINRTFVRHTAIHTITSLQHIDSNG